MPDETDSQDCGRKEERKKRHEHEPSVTPRIMSCTERTEIERESERELGCFALNIYSQLCALRRRPVRKIKAKKGNSKENEGWERT